MCFVILMNKSQRQQITQKARHYWDTEQPFQTGGVIFESIPVDLRHQWAAKILEVAYAHFPPDARIEAVLDFAKFPEKWGKGVESRHSEAHRIVSNVNWQEHPLLSLATQVGKIVYTAQQYPAPFDHGAGWKIAEDLKQIVQQLSDPEFTVQAWMALANEEFILLEENVMCHPACPTCTLRGLTPFSR